MVPHVHDEDIKEKLGGDLMTCKNDNPVSMNV